VTWHNRYM